MSLIGTLDDVKLADVLRLLASSQKTGLLSLTAPGRQALMRFQKGEVVHAASGRIEGDDAVIDAFGWREGQLTFVAEEKALPPNVTRGVEALVLEGTRVGDAFHRMQDFITTDRVVFRMVASLPDEARYTLGCAEWKLLRLLDGSRNVRELIEESRLSRHEVMRLLFEMSEAGLIEKADLQKSLRAQAQRRFGKDSAAEVEERLAEEWRRLPRFSRGIHRVEVRRFARGVVLPVAFRPGLFRDVSLPRSALTELEAAEGDEVLVRPVA